MKLLRIGGKLINWDLVTDVRIGEDRSGTKKIYVQFGTHRIQLTGPEATGFERWMEHNHQIVDIEPVFPPRMPR